MTDNEIVKAFEKVLDKKETILLSFFGKGGRAKVITAQDMIDLINRQKEEKETMQEYINCLRAEVERLNKEVDRLSQCVMYHDGQIADAIKDLTEKLYEKIEQNSKFGFAYVTKKEIENVVREVKENERKID